MRIAHLLRKYNPSEWGGTETAVKRLLNGLHAQGVSSVVFAPRLKSDPAAADPLAASGHSVRRYRSFLPVCRISAEQRRQLISVGGNLMSFDLLGKLLREPGLSAIHTHALNRLAGIAALAARLRRLPLIVTIHGGFMDLPAAVHENLIRPLQGGIEWGKIFGFLLRSRDALKSADAIITCNRREAVLLSEKYPDRRILVQPHAVAIERFQEDQRCAAWKAFPQIEGKRVLLTVGRIDPVKNQLWLIEQLPAILERHRDLVFVLAGACTDEAYGKSLKKEVRNLRLEESVLFTGGMIPEEPRLIGLFQTARALVVPSVSETFGLTILESWAARTPVISSRTSGANELIRQRENGWLFDLERPEEFHAAIDEAFWNDRLHARIAEAGQMRVAERYDVAKVAGEMKKLYSELSRRVAKA